MARPAGVSRETPAARHAAAVRTAAATAEARPGALVHACTDSRRCIGTRGLPDVLVIGLAGILAVEIKTGSGQPTPGQTQWLWTLRALGCTAVSLNERELAAGHLDQLLDRAGFPPATT